VIGLRLTGAPASALTFEPPMLNTIGFLVTFLFGGTTGVILASPPMNFAVSDSYFVVAHFHYVLAGTVLFAVFAGFYFWWPKFTGKMLGSKLGKIQFWLLFTGFHMTFLVQHWTGVQGQVRRTANYPDLPGDSRPERHLERRIVGSRAVRAAVLVERLRYVAVRQTGHRGRPVGVLLIAGMGHLLPAAAAQLLPHPPDRVRAPGVRSALPAYQDRARVTRAGASRPRASWRQVRPRTAMTGRGRARSSRSWTYRAPATWPYPASRMPRNSAARALMPVSAPNTASPVALRARACSAAVSPEIATTMSLTASVVS
jgi:hypothetical protein